MSTPAGWYPDPADAGRMRWWDGAQWTEHTSPLAAPESSAAEPAQAEPAAEEPVAAESAAAPHVPPIPTESQAASSPEAPHAPAAPRYGEYAPAAPVAPAAPAQQYASAPPYGGSAPYGGAAAPYGGAAAAPAWTQTPTGPSAPGADTNTIWIYLCIAVSFLPVLTIFLIDWNAYFDAIVLIETGDSASVAAATAGMLEWMGRIMLISLLSYLFIGVSIVFAWLDWRELKKRGVARPFHWGFAFFALIVSIAVYVIGRAVVLKRETGGGLTALWVWIGSVVVAIIISIVWFTQMWQQMINSFMYLS